MQQLQIKSVEPKELKEELQVNNKIFNNFVNDETISLIQQIRGFAQQKSQEIESIQKQILNMKTNAYQENFVNYFLDMAGKKQQAGNVAIPQKIQDKINNLNSLGGIQKIRSLVQLLKESNVKCGLILSNLQTSLELEQQEDSSQRSKHTNKWTRPASSEVNKEYLSELTSLQENFKVACSIEMDNQSRWTSNQFVVEAIQQPKEQQLKLFGVNSAEDDFKAQNVQQLIRLENVDKEVSQYLTSIRECVQSINDTIRNSNYQETVLQAQKNKVPPEQMYETALGPVSSLANSLNSIIERFSTKVSEACSIAIDLQQRRGGGGGQGGNMQQQEKYSGGLNTLIELFGDCEQGQKFYQDLTALAQELESKVNAFIQARQNEKNNLIQMIQNEAQKNQFVAPGFTGNFFPAFNAPAFDYSQQFQANPNTQFPQFQQFPSQQHSQVPQVQPFFNAGQFPVGSSVFVPKKQ